MSTAAAHLAHQYRMAYGAGRMNLRGISTDEAVRVPDGGGSSANWITGHIVYVRGAILRFLGLDPVAGSDRLEPYTRGSTVPSVEDAVPIKELVGMWKASQQALEQALAGATDELFAKPLDEPDPRLGETIGSALAFFAFHEGYHVGQIGITRRRLGLEGAIS